MLMHEFSNSDQWWESIPEDIRPHKDQPFYHLLAENAENTYVAYVSEQNLEPDYNPEPVSHPQVAELFDTYRKTGFTINAISIHTENFSMTALRYLAICIRYAQSGLLACTNGSRR